MVVANAVQAVAMPIRIIAATSMVLRPMRSPSGPSIPAPKVIPITTAESASPKLASGKPQLFASDGTASAIT